MRLAQGMCPRQKTVQEYHALRWLDAISLPNCCYRETFRSLDLLIQSHDLLMHLGIILWTFLGTENLPNSDDLLVHHVQKRSEFS